MAQRSPEKLPNTNKISPKHKSYDIMNEIPDITANNIFSKLTNDERKQYTSKVARYLLLGQNRGVPIKRKEIQEQIGSTHSRAVLPILKSADKVLRDTAGLAILEFSKGINNKFYVLINILEVDPELQREFVERDTESSAQLSLLLVILSLIMMKQTKVKEEDIWDFLLHLNIPEGDVQHPVLGNVKKLLEEWCRQMYLDKYKEPIPDKVNYYYIWGERAKVEFPPEKILHFIAKVHGDDPRSWLRIHKHLLADKLEQTESLTNPDDTSTQK
ncbi:Necdin-like 2 variant 2 [Oopsacas minuta]|uniref:Necdin-like 2 variant 2 n=1 Tax=Oopsacas minuta TaxID=111878 RepID=A0AAV7KI67_9METZ|nr:Necdin-like 2 variant 2 [Oopsacas minuta]